MFFSICSYFCKNGWMFLWIFFMYKYRVGKIKIGCKKRFNFVGYVYFKLCFIFSIWIIKCFNLCYYIFWSCKCVWMNFFVFFLVNKIYIFYKFFIIYGCYKFWKIRDRYFFSIFCFKCNIFFFFDIINLLFVFGWIIWWFFFFDFVINYVINLFGCCYMC